MASEDVLQAYHEQVQQGHAEQAQQVLASFEEACFSGLKGLLEQLPALAPQLRSLVTVPSDNLPQADALPVGDLQMWLMTLF